MRFGLLLTSVHDRSVPPGQQIAEHQELISLAVDAGMDLVVAGQHFVAPNLRYLQPIPYLASLATQFPSVRVATGIILLPLNHPVRVAEEAATLDVITNGRMILGVGGGYLQDEFDAFGIERSSRVARMEEGLPLIRELWTGGPVTAETKYFQLDEVSISTVPIQEPNPPIWLGAQSEPAVRRAARLADAWYVPPFPTHRELIDLYQIYLEERAGNPGFSVTPIPVRREVYLAEGRAEAIAAVDRGAASRYGTYADWGQELGSTGLTGSDWLDSRFLLGNSETVIHGLRTMTEHVEHSDFIYKPQWPGQDHKTAMRQLEMFGNEIIPHFLD